MKSISLNGKYNLYFYDATAYSADTPEQLKADCVKKITANVPGNVEFALSEHGYLPKDLFYSQNILKTCAYESWDFWYERDFTLTEEQLKRAVKTAEKTKIAFITLFFGETDDALIKSRTEIVLKNISGKRINVFGNINNAAIFK